MSDLKSKSQFCIVRFSLFYPAKIFKRSYKNNKHRKRPLPLQGRFDISFVRLAFESFDVYLSQICKKIPEHEANGAKQGEFIDDVSKYRKIVGALFKGK